MHHDPQSVALSIDSALTLLAVVLCDSAVTANEAVAIVGVRGSLGYLRQQCCGEACPMDVDVRNIQAGPLLPLLRQAQDALYGLSMEVGGSIVQGRMLRGCMASLDGVIKRREARAAVLGPARSNRPVYAPSGHDRRECQLPAGDR